MSEPFRVVVADPPWMFGDQLGERGAEANYPCMTPDDIRRFIWRPQTVSLPMNPRDEITRQVFEPSTFVPGEAIADDAILFLWRLSSLQEEALSVIRRWDFEPKSEVVWLKRTTTGGRFFGLGRYVRNEHETCLIARRGQPKILDRAIRSTFEAPAGRHSEKPEFFYREIVEKLAAGPYLELFSRRARSGWTCLGNEVAP